MSKRLQSTTSSSSFRYSSGSDGGSVARGNGRNGYGRLLPDGAYESATPSFSVRVPRRLRVVKLASRMTSSGGQVRNGKLQLGASGQAVKEPSRTFLGRLRVAYERVMVKAASKSGEFSAVPPAKASRAPPALSSVVSTWTVSSGSRVGAKIADLDPGFKMNSAEKKYLEHLKRSASCRTF